MKKTLVLFGILIFSMALIGCSSKPKLYVLNWGEYINEDLVDRFEKEYGVRVILSLADSNEAMEQRVKEGTTAYDIVIPSDYMIEKLWDEGYLQSIDLSKLTNFNQSAFVPGLDGIMSMMFQDNSEVTDAYTVSIPYFWGVFGIMYNRQLAGLEDYIEEKQWGAIFEVEPTSLFTRALKIGMYDVSRFAYSASLIYANDVELINDAQALNTFSNTYLQQAESILSQRKYHTWATDMLKKDVEAGNLDLAFLYVGDFFDTYLILTEDATTPEQAAQLTSHIGIFIPDTTIAFYDGMIIPAVARNVDLAHLFIDYFLDPEIAYENSGIVGYTTVLTETATMIETASKGDLIRSVMASAYPYNPSHIENFVAIPLIAFSNANTDTIASMINRVKSK
jgi:spermidine/putrescine-binding protein